MGGNYIPEDCIYSRITPEVQKYLLESCKRANFNCVRVWGGGYYPSDHFYDLCDEMGLIVWQDLMFACNVYDLTEEFEDNITKEITENVKRLRHHASLGLWCGNNEMESAWDHWPEVQSESKYLRADYIKMFEYVIPKAVRAADSETFSGSLPQAPEAALMIRTMRTEETVTTGMYGMVRSLLQIIRSIIFVSARSLASSLFRA